MLDLKNVDNFIMHVFIVMILVGIDYMIRGPKFIDIIYFICVIGCFVNFLSIKYNISC